MAWAKATSGPNRPLGLDTGGVSGPHDFAFWFHIRTVLNGLL